MVSDKMSKEMKYIRQYLFTLFALLITVGVFAQNNKIYYTSTDDRIVTPYSEDGFGDATLVSNTYNYGIGCMEFDKNVTTIGGNAFYNCSTLASIEIPASVLAIAQKAFWYCANLSSVTINSQLTLNVIYQYVSSVFAPAVQEYILNGDIAYVAESKFYGCSGLRKVVIPSSVTTLASMAFQGCTNLQSVEVQWEVPLSYNEQEVKGIFDGVDLSKVTLDTPCGKGNEYGHHNGWSAFGTIDDSHHFETDLHDDSKAYTCSKCGYVDQALKAQYEGRDYLSMTAVGGDMTIGMKKADKQQDGYTTPDVMIQYSADRIHWASRTLSESTADDNPLVVIPAGETRYFRRGSTVPATRISRNESNFWTFTMTGAGTIEAGGSIMSLLDITVKETQIKADHAFTRLFEGCGKLTVAPKVPATTLNQGFCYVRLFAGTGITEAPELPAALVPDGAYVEMFKDCKELVKAPKLLASSLRRRSYDGIFNGCEKLSEVEIGNVTEIIITDTREGQGAFNNWLVGTAAQGIVVAPFAMVQKAEVAKHTPAGWFWKSSISANEDQTEGKAGNFYTTFCDSRSAYLIPAGVKVYTAKLAKNDEGKTTLTLSRVEGGVIPKGTAVLMHSKTGDIAMTTCPDAPAIEGNDFFGTDAETAQSQKYHYYMFTYGQNGLGFYKMKTSTALAANKSYIQIEKDQIEQFEEGSVEGWY